MRITLSGPSLIKMGSRADATSWAQSGGGRSSRWVRPSLLSLRHKVTMLLVGQKPNR